jgi:hypothetical protein
MHVRRGLPGRLPATSSGRSRANPPGVPRSPQVRDQDQDQRQRPSQRRRSRCTSGSRPGCCRGSVTRRSAGSSSGSASAGQQPQLPPRARRRPRPGPPIQRPNHPAELLVSRAAGTTAHAKASYRLVSADTLDRSARKRKRAQTREKASNRGARSFGRGVRGSSPCGRQERRVPRP